ncbi:MAG TPA: hypothetical protein VHQ04_09285, partial [Puia sp.]|nr:hypothetical protein [Puia sp.]
MRKVNLDFDAIAFFKAYNFSELLNWLQVIICYPSNQRFINRIEFLIGQLLAIPSNEFKGDPVTRQDIVRLFDGTKKSYDALFFTYEDFTAFPQENLIPLFFEGERFYFFYAGLERPYEYYTELIDRYFISPLKDIPGMQEIKSLLDSSLCFQTQLLLKIREEYKKPVNQEGICIPDDTFYQSVVRFFYDVFQPKNELVAYAIPIGAVKHKSLQEIMEALIGMKLFNKKLFVNMGDRVAWLYPHLHCKMIMDMARSLVQENSSAHALLQQNLCDRLIYASHNLFSLYKTVINVTSDKGTVNLNIDHAVFTDRNKLILFKTVEYSWQEDVSDALEAAIYAGGKTVDKLKSLPELTIAVSSDDTYQVSTAQIEIILIVVFDILTLNVKAVIQKLTWNYDQLYCLAFMDLLALFSELKHGMNVIKYLKDENALRKSAKGYMGEYIERFAFYIQNGNTFTRTAQTYNFVTFVPHMWHDYLHPKLWENAKDEAAWLEIHRKTKNFFNMVEKPEPGIWRLTKTSNTSGAFLLQLPSTFVWVMLPDFSQQLTEFEFSTSYNLVGELFKEYLKKHEDSFTKLLSEIGLSPSRASILFIPQRRFDFSHWSFLKQYFTGSDTGIEIQSLYENDRNEMASFLVFDGEKLGNHFSGKQNDGERLCMTLYINSLCILAGMSAVDAHAKAQEFVDQILPVAPKRYSAAYVTVENPKLSMYNPPCRFNDSDFGAVNRLISAWIMQNQILPGSYEGPKAMEIAGNLYTYILKT